MAKTAEKTEKQLIFENMLEGRIVKRVRKDTKSWLRGELVAVDPKTFGKNKLFCSVARLDSVLLLKHNVILDDVINKNDLEEP